MSKSDETKVVEAKAVQPTMKLERDANYSWRLRGETKTWAEAGLAFDVLADALGHCDDNGYQVANREEVEKELR